MKYFLLIVFSFIIIASPALAGNLQSSSGLLNTAAGQAGYNISEKNPESVVAKVINAVLSMLAVIFLVLMVYGGFIWMTARGNDQQVDKAKGILVAAIIGVIIIVSAYAITFFVLSQVGSQTLQ